MVDLIKPYKAGAFQDMGGVQRHLDAEFRKLEQSFASTYDSVSQLSDATGAVADAVLYSAQSLTAPQKSQARTNIGTYGNRLVSLASGTTIDNTYIGAVITCSGSGGSFTLPAASTVDKSIFIFRQTQSGNLTINRAGSDAIYGTNKWNTTSVVLSYLGAMVALLSDGTNWSILNDSRSEFGANIGIGLASAGNAGILYAGTLTGGVDVAAAQISPTISSPGGTIGPIYCIAASPLLAAGSTTVGTAINTRVEPWVKGAGNTITNCYGLYVDQQTAGTNNYSVFVTGGISQFDGQLIGKGTSTNDNISTGYLGEYVESDVPAASAVSVSNATATNITSISLTAGDWDVWGAVGTLPAGATTTSTELGWLSTTSATLPTDTNKGAYAALAISLGAGAGMTFPIGRRRLSLASTTTVYLSTYLAFAVSTMQAMGCIAARRVR
jgi:hypothetical protein